jgi:hypothetical protein
MWIVWTSLACHSVGRDSALASSDCQDGSAPTTFWEDADGDGYGGDHEVSACVQDDGLATNDDDCDDFDPARHPGAIDVCGNPIDEDCDGHAASCGGFKGDYDLSDAVVLSCSLSDYDAGRLVEAGDVTGDGLDDVLVATLLGDGGKGGGYVVAGPVTGNVDLDADAIRISSSSETYGASRSIGLGDVNADGIADVSFGAPFSVAQGQYIVLGPITGDVDLAADRDAALIGSPDTFAGHGSDLGDIDGDGYADSIVGAYDEAGATGVTGVVFVEYGPVSGDVDLEADADVRIGGIVPDSWTGRMIVAGADIDGDGIGDIAINSVQNSSAAPRTGGVYVVDGPASIASLADADGWLVGPTAEAYAGQTLTVGDYDGDGRADVAACASRPDFGSVYVALGPATGSIDLAKADMIIEATVADQELGLGLGSGDVDGDGVDELVIGAPADHTGGQGAGAAFLVFAPPAGTSSITDAAQASFWGASMGEQAGWGVATGDVDGDGQVELLIGGPGISKGGGVYVERPGT